MSIAEAVVLMFGGSLIVASLAVVVLAIVVLRVAKLYAPVTGLRRPVPAFGKRSTTDSGVVVDSDVPPIPGKNAWPNRDKPQPAGVDEDAVVTHVLGEAEGQNARDRTKWWQEQRDEGLDDDEIAELEEQHIVPLFETE